MQTSLLVNRTLVAALLAVIQMTSSCATSHKSAGSWTEAPQQLAGQIRKQEVEVWEALRTKDKAADANLIAEDFVGVYKNGFGNRAEHVSQIDGEYQLTDYKIENVRVLQVSEGSAMIVYRATCHATGTWADDCSRPMYISSLWVNRDGKWVNTFSQDTPAVKQ